MHTIQAARRLSVRVVPISVLLVSAGLSSGSAAGQLNQPFPAVFELSSLEASGGALGFVINGIDEGVDGIDGNASGRSVSSAGDVNADGIDDVIIGAFLTSPNGNLLAGASYVVFGGVGIGSFGSLELSSLNGATGFVINGIDAFDQSGGAVSSAGDVNGDGVDDLLIGASRGDAKRRDAGESYVVFGGSSIGSSGVIDLSSLDGTTGFVINGIDLNDRSGSSVSSAGDINADGVDDLIIGADKASPNGNRDAGESYVVFGGPAVGSSGVIDLSSLDGSTGFVINGIERNDFSGQSVSSAGDVNADGVADLLIGASIAGPVLTGTTGSNGASYVVFGGVGVGSSGSLELSSLNGATGFVINGIDAFDASGYSVSSAGDVNADGVADLLIGAFGGDPNGNSSAGESYVVFGGAGIGSSGSLELPSLDGTTGFVVNGIDESDWSGYSVSSAGDVNADGVADLLIGAPEAEPNGNSAAGESYVVFGGPGVGSSGVVELSSLDGATGFVINGIDAGDISGRSVSSAGDVNADGVADLLIGAPSVEPNGNFGAGKSYVIFGRDLGSACLADTNGDGMVTPADYNAWILAFNNQSPECDQNGDGACTPADFNGWILNFNAGC